MGRSRRPQPERLAEKLREIRMRLEISQGQMVTRLGDTKTKLHAPHISGFERGMREPSLPVLLQYARVARVQVEVLIDDGLDLPDHLIGKSEGKRKARMR